MRKFNQIMALSMLGSLLLLPQLAFAESSAGVGDMAENLLVPTAIVTKLVLIACYVIGFIFVFMAMAQYKIHRQSPKLVPLGTPIILLILGIVALLVPYTTNLGNTGKAEAEVDKGTPLPFETKSPKGPGIPLPPMQKGNHTPPPEPTPAPAPDTPAPSPDMPAPDNGPSVTPEAPPADEGGGSGWTDDPRYN
jgi:hypothetical protein